MKNAVKLASSDALNRVIENRCFGARLRRFAPRSTRKVFVPKTIIFDRVEAARIKVDTLQIFYLCETWD